MLKATGEVILNSKKLGYAWMPGRFSNIGLYYRGETLEIL